jgi:hypothetical protein
MASLAIELLISSRNLGLSLEELSDSGMVKVVDICVSGLSMTLDNSDSVENLENQSLLTTLLKVYSRFVTSDMLNNQSPVTSISSHLRSSSVSVTNSFNSQLISIPRTALESIQPTSQQQSVELSPILQYPLQFSISEIHTLANTSTESATNTNVVRNESQRSLPMILSFETQPCASNSKGCLVKINLQNKIPTKLTKSQSLAESSPESFEIVCTLDEKVDHEFECPSGDLLRMSCNGSFAGVGRVLCPIRSNVVDCKTRVTSSDGSDQKISCQPSQESNESVTICLCDLSEVNVGKTDSVSFSILSIEKSVVSDFVSTWETAPSLSATEVGDSWVVLLTISSIGGFFTLCVLLSMRYDLYEQKVSSVLSNQAEVLESNTTLKVSHKTEEGRNVPAVSEYVKLMEESLPSIFKNNSLWLKFQEEMRVYHRWFGILFFYSPVFPRSLRVLSLFSSIVMMLFIQSVTYNIADPDDGSCEDCQQNQSCCWSLKSTLNLNTNRCYWKPLSSMNVTSIDSGSCHFRDIGEDMIRMFIVALISAILTAPLALSIQYLVANVLSKESVTEEQLKKERQESQMKRRERSKTQRISVDGKELVESCGRSLQEDLNNILNELSVHYTALVVDKKRNDAKEFRSKYSPQVHVSLSNLY